MTIRVSIPFYLVILLLLCTLSCAGDLEKTKKEKNLLNARTDFGKDIEVNYTENAIRTAHLTAPTMMKQEDSAYRTFFPDGIKLEMYDILGAVNSTLTAKYGEHDHKTDQMKARDSVFVNGVDGKSLRAKELIWIKSERKMISYGSVEIKNKTEIIFGDTLFADENLHRYVVKKVRGIVHVTK